MYGVLRWAMRVVTRGYLAGGLFHVYGAENVPRSGGLIICPNHSATLDPPLVPAFVPRNDTWSMAKVEYFRGGFGEAIFRRYHAFPVVRHTADRAALRRSFQILEDGQALILYPEGTRIDSGVLAQPEPGAGFIAQRAQCPVVPVALFGSRDCLPRGAKWPRRKPVSVTFGKPFIVARKRANGERVSFEDASATIMLKIAELLPADKRGEFSDLETLQTRLEGIALPVPSGLTKES